MTADYTTRLRLTRQGDNDNPSTWGDVVNAGVITLIDEAIAGVAVINVSGSSNIDLSVTAVNGGTDSVRKAVLELTGTPTGNILLILPAVEKAYLVRAAFTGGYTVGIRPVGGSSPINIVTGQSKIVYISATNIYEVGGTANGLQPGNNLSDVLNTGTSRTNLGLAIGTNVQAYAANLTAFAAFNTNGMFAQVAPGNFTSRTLQGAGGIVIVNGDGISGNPTIAAPITIIPTVVHDADYTTVLADQGTSLLHLSADTSVRTWTIDSNANVAYPIGTCITFENQDSAGTITIAITADLMRLAGAGTAGSRTLAPNGIATAKKQTATTWIISGVGLT